MTRADPARAERRERLDGLMRGALTGNRDDLDAVVAELTPMLWRVARSLGLDAADGEDVVQTTWLTLLTHIDQIRTPEALVGWLTTVTRREALRVATGRSREKPIGTEDLAPIPDGGPPVDSSIVDEERRVVLWRVIHELPERCIRLLQVVAFSDRPSYAAVAEGLGMPKGSIGPTRGRCLDKLRTLLLSQPDWSWP
jgi:RNA polymerase sigma factor (sigma-70 family)